MDNEELLNEFIEIQREKFRIGSGDDGYFEQQVIDYINKQKPLWIDFINYLKNSKGVEK